MFLNATNVSIYICASSAVCVSFANMYMWAWSCLEDGRPSPTLFYSLLPLRTPAYNYQNHANRHSNCIFLFFLTNGIPGFRPR